MQCSAMPPAAPPSPPVAMVSARLSGRSGPRWLVLVAAAALIGCWGTWASFAFRAQTRTVSVDEFRQDLASGDVTAYVAATELDGDRVWPPVDDSRFATVAIDASGRPTDSRDTRRIEAIAYYVGAPSAPVRLVLVTAGETPDADAPPYVDERVLVQELRAAGVRPEDFRPSPGWTPNPYRGPAELWSLALVALAFVSLIVLRPARGTRWFWFWMLLAPLALGVLSYALAELALRKRTPVAASGEMPAREGDRLPGWLGFGLALLTAVLVPF